MNRKKKTILIIIHVLAFALILFLAVSFIKSCTRAGGIISEPEPTASAVPEVTAPIVEPGETASAPTPTIQPTAASSAMPTSTAPSAAASPSPTAGATVKPTDKPTAKPTATAAPTVKPTVVQTAEPTSDPTPRPTPKPTVTPTPAPTPTEDPSAFSYSVYDEIGVAPAGYTFVFVSIDPPGNYSVTYDGSPMTATGSEYYAIVPILPGGGYASHVSVSRS